MTFPFRKIFKGPRTLSWKITIVYTLMFIIVLLILNGTVYILISNYVENNAQQSIKSTMDYIVPRIRGLEGGRLNIYDVDFLQEISRTEGDIYFRVLNYNQEVIAQSSILQQVDVPVKQGFKAFENEERQFASRTILIASYGSLHGYLQVVRDITLENEFLDFLFTVLLVTGVVGSIIAVIIGYITTRKTLQPIEEITKTARTLSVSDLGKRLELDRSEDELTDLAHTFNSMLARLEKSFSRQQEFVSDASHELRTPVSVIQGYIDLLDRWGKHEEEVRDEAINAIKEEVKSINHLLENLLFLARGESDNIEINKENFSFDEVIREVVSETRMLAEDIDIIYSEGTDKIVDFYGDRKMIKQLLRIFIDNSIKYTTSGGKIKIGLKKWDEKLQITIEDTGCGIPEEDLPHIFERFYRVDKSRSNAEKKGGTGLGLSIARWIIDMHDGDIDVDSRVGEGTKIIVTFSC